MRLFPLIIAIILAALFFASSSAEEEIKKDFDIRQFLTHNTHSFAITKQSTAQIADVTTSLFITPQNETQAILAKYTTFNNATQETTENINYTISFDEADGNKGVFSLADKTAFQFAFQMINHVAISVGTADAASGDKYQWVIPTHDRWVFTVYTKTGEVKEIYVAKKIFTEVPKTFFQQYGTYIMMFGLMALNMWVQNKTKNMQQNQAEEAARAVAGTNTADEFVDGGKKDNKKAAQNKKQPTQPIKTPQAKKED